MSASFMTVQTLLAGGAVVVAAAVGAGAAWSWHRARAARAEADFLATRVTEMLGVAPDGHVRWSRGPDGALAEDGAVSRRLAILLDLFKGTDSDFDDVLDRFKVADAANLKRATERLRADGEGFEMEIGMKEGGRRVLAYGLRASDDGGRPMADVVWMRDITDGVAGAYGLAREKEKLEKDLGRLSGLLDALPVPMWLRDEGLAIVWCNKAYARAVDMPTPAAAVAEGWELAPGDGAREARALAARARAAGEPRSQEVHLILDGARRLVELTEAPVAVPEDAGHRYTAGIAVDVSSLDEARDRVERQAEAHATVLENLPTAMAVFDSRMRLVFRNRAFEALWSLDPEWLNSEPSYSAYLDALRERRLLPEVADYPAFKQREIDRFTGLVEAIEDLQHLPDGSTLLRAFTPHPMGGLMVTFEDVTDLLALESAYNSMMRVQRETLDHLAEAVAVFGPDGFLKLSNAALAEMWKIAPESLTEDTHMAQVIDAQKAFFGKMSDWEGFKAGLLGRVGGRSVHAGRLERSDGRVLDYLCTPLTDGGAVLAYQDVTEQVGIERALRDRNQALKEADRLKSAFIANVSRELHAPLGALLGFVDKMAAAGKLSRAQSDALKGISETAAGLETVVDGVVAMASIDAGEATLHLDAFDVATMVEEVLDLVTERVRQGGLVLDVAVEDAIGWMVADRKRIKQVLYTLLNNAVKFTPEGGGISVSARLDRGDVVFAVTDGGVSLPKADRDKLFDPFTKLKGSKGAPTAVGLGLAVVKRFVELHGGEVSIGGGPGEGSTVTCRLPAGHGAEERQLSILDAVAQAEAESRSEAASTALDADSGAEKAASRKAAAKKAPVKKTPANKTPAKPRAARKPAAKPDAKTATKTADHEGEA